jgi:predicted RNA-binding Zn-ribbon protein involved in translation (DUF1610 family)
MSHACFISFKKEDICWKNAIVNKLGTKRILGKSLDCWIDSDDLDYVMQVIRDDYMKGTTVTIFLIGQHSSEGEGLDFKKHNIQSFIIRELQATLYNRKGNPRDGLLGVVLPDMEKIVFSSSFICPRCGEKISIVNISDSTVIREFSANYWLKPDSCGHFEETRRYCVLVRYNDFMNNPDYYINKAYQKTLDPISEQVHYKDISHNGI